MTSIQNSVEHQYIHVGNIIAHIGVHKAHNPSPWLGHKLNRGGRAGQSGTSLLRGLLARLAARREWRSGNFLGRTG